MGIVRHLCVLANAAKDLRQLRDTDPKAAAAVVVALEQIRADPDAIDKMTTHGDNQVGTSKLGIKRWETARGQGNFWRFRALNTPATSYRVVYGYNWQARQLCVLAVVHKDDFDYDDLTTDISKRILADWQSL